MQPEANFKKRNTNHLASEHYRGGKINLRKRPLIQKPAKYWKTATLLNRDRRTLNHEAGKLTNWAGSRFGSGIPFCRNETNCKTFFPSATVWQKRSPAQCPSLCPFPLSTCRRIGSLSLDCYMRACAHQSAEWYVHALTQLAPILA